MAAFVVILLAALSRLVPHALHGVGLDITAVGGGLLFFGSRQPRWQTPFAVALMALTDVYLTTVVYGLRFHPQDYLVTWAWYLSVALLGSALLRKVTVLRVGAAVMASATGFFLLSNLVVWLSGTMYAHSAAGLGVCYVAALPFYANDLISTGLTCGVLFGLPVVAARLVGLLQGGEKQQPLT